MFFIYPIPVCGVKWHVGEAKSLQDSPIKGLYVPLMRSPVTYRSKVAPYGEPCHTHTSH